MCDYLCMTYTQTVRPIGIAAPTTSPGGAELMQAADARYRPPPITMFGDGSQVLGAVGARSSLAGSDGPVVTFGAFRLPSRGRGWRLRALRRKAQKQTLRSVVQMAPVAAVIALDASHSNNSSRARALGARLAEDVSYISDIRYGHRLPTVVVLVRGPEGRQKLAANLHRGLFHHSDAYRGLITEADDLP